MKVRSYNCSNHTREYGNAWARALRSKDGRMEARVSFFLGGRGEIISSEHPSRLASRHRSDPSVAYLDLGRPSLPLSNSKALQEPRVFSLASRFPDLTCRARRRVTEVDRPGLKVSNAISPVILLSFDRVWLP
ncbi:hypothetical protein RRG08_001094 [Elysia crispata]|uniref:Uncharacterized protein n=1 Tax=Elysia crispata TaxID=231223 RepID=A0AAE1AVY6_9GAST|nr:hypothetical protein RRG08_001094 [Elysia crispata]